MLTDVVSLLTQIHGTNSNIGEYLNLLFDSAPIGVIWVGFDAEQKSPVLKGCNQWVVQQSGMSNSNDAIGKSALEFIATQSSPYLREDEFAEIEDLHKSLLVTRRPFTNQLLPYHQTNGDFSYVSMSGIPIAHDNQVLGGVSLYSNITPKNTHHILNVSKCFFRTFLDSLKEGHTYYITLEKKPITLTPKQTACLTHLAMGKSAKQIANLEIFQCSPRTVEDHIMTLKRKLGVHTTLELINCFWKSPIQWF